MPVQKSLSPQLMRKISNKCGVARLQHQIQNWGLNLC